MDECCCDLIEIIFSPSFIILKKISIKEIIYILLVSFPNVIDFILTIFGFTSELKIYFIIRLISQIFIFFYFLLVYDLYRERNRDWIGNSGPAFSCALISYFVVICESISLIYFVERYDKMSKFYKVGYFFHLLAIPLCIYHYTKIKY